MKKFLNLIKPKVLYIFGVILLTWILKESFIHSTGFRSFYLHSFYPALGRILRFLTGWFPFSIGDIIYILAIAWLLIGLIKLIKYLIYARRYPFQWLNTLFRFILITVSAYVIFWVFWGANYQFKRLYHNTGVERTKYTQEELVMLCDTLASRVNQIHLSLASSDTMPVKDYPSFREIKKLVPLNYARISNKLPFLNYSYPSIKPSMFGYLMNYAGITGYFNPFTGEGQVNTLPMPVSLPFTACHEVAHQLGYSAEGDANFIGYLVAAHSPDPYFRYSANFVMFLYAINVVSFQRPKVADSLWRNLISTGVRKDYDAYFAFYEQFQTRMKPVLNNLYDNYLKANEQKRGIRSYDDVISLILDYERHNGKIL